jgi:DNA-directed RNA polymerase subunit M/transcription elongation factor TFIIS
MYYLKIKEGANEEDTTLIYYCRNCGHEDTSLNAENICVSETQLRRNENKYTQMVNEYTKYDPTLPRINTIKCPNQECSSNLTAGGGTSAEGTTSEGTAIIGAPATMRIKKRTSKKNPASEAASSVAASSVAAAASVAAEAASVADTAASVADIAVAASTAIPLAQTNREVIYIRYDDINMKYVYLCVHCDTMWKTDYRN